MPLPVTVLHNIMLYHKIVPISLELFFKKMLMGLSGAWDSSTKPACYLPKTKYFWNDIYFVVLLTPLRDFHRTCWAFAHLQSTSTWATWRHRIQTVTNSWSEHSHMIPSACLQLEALCTSVTSVCAAEWTLTDKHCSAHGKIKRRKEKFRLKRWIICRH